VTLDNQFGSLAVTVRRARALCAPAIKNGEQPPGSAEGAFLTDYSITRGGPAARVPGHGGEPVRDAHGGRPDATVAARADGLQRYGGAVTHRRLPGSLHVL